MSTLKNYEALQNRLAKNDDGKGLKLPELVEGNLTINSESFETPSALWQALQQKPIEGGWLQTPQVNQVVKGALSSEPQNVLQAEFFGGDTSWHVDYYEGKWRIVTWQSGAGEPVFVSKKTWLSDYSGVKALTYEVFFQADKIRGYRTLGARLVSMEMEGKH